MLQSMLNYRTSSFNAAPKISLEKKTAPNVISEGRLSVDDMSGSVVEKAIKVLMVR